MIYKLNVKKQIKASADALFFFFLFFLLVEYNWILDGKELFYILKNYPILYIVLFLFSQLLTSIPVVVMHYNFIAKGLEVIEINNNQIIVGGIKYEKEDIQKATLFASNNYLKNTTVSRSFLHEKTYYYVKIEMKDGEVLNITSLVVPKIDKVLKVNFEGLEIKIERGRFFTLLI